jgi:starch synthase
MRVAHLLRKYNPAEWGGTETAIKRLLDGLKFHRVENVVHCPRLNGPLTSDPLGETGCEIRRYKAFVPVWGISPEQKQQLVSVGGNLMSLDLPTALLADKELSVIHTHTGNRLGGIAMTVARRRNIPLVASIHGGVLDLPEQTKEYLRQPLKGGVEWGKVFGLFLRSRQVLEKADAVFTCNRKEASLLQAKFPKKRIIVQAHGVPADVYAKEHREAAQKAFPQIVGKQVLLIVGRLDPVKNQKWVVEQISSTFAKFPKALLVLAGSCTDVAYGEQLKQKICQVGIGDRILLTGGLPPGDPRLIGLFQSAEVVLLPSISETFGLVILEAWAAGTPVISSRTSGAKELIEMGKNGWLFDLDNPAAFNAVVEDALTNKESATRFAEAGRVLVTEKFDTNALAGQVKKVYEELIEEKK